MLVVDAEAIQAVARYVRSKRGGLTVAAAAKRADLSTRKWHQVEAGKGHHRDTTLIKVATGLGESPKALFEVAGLPYDGTDDAPDLEERVSAVEASLTEVRETVRQVVDHLGIQR